MGCDIHLYVERKRTINNEQKWVSIDHFKKNPYYGDYHDEKELDHVPVYRDRNYYLFSVLADVRNYSGNEPISQPKGLPKDVSDTVKKEAEYWEGDGHSHSYFTLEELKEARKSRMTTKFSGMVEPNGVTAIQNGMMPASWCQATTSKSAVFMEWEHETDFMKPLIDALEKRKREEFFIYTDEERPDFDDKVRIVFWFDN